MTTISPKDTSKLLPVTHDLFRTYTLTSLVALLLIFASASGLLAPSTLYSSEAARQSFLANDVINLLIGLPILLVAMGFTHRGSLVGLLLWPGALLYTLYNYIVNLFGVQAGWMTPVYLALVLLCAALIFDILRHIDWNAIKACLAKVVPEKIPGGYLVVFGVLFIFRAVDLLIQAGGALPLPELGLLIADIVLSVACIAGGILLLRRHPLGYTSSLGLLFGSSMLFIGLIALLLIRPSITGIPFDLSELLAVVGLSLFCLIPFGLYLGGVIRSTKQKS